MKRILLLMVALACGGQADDLVDESKARLLARVETEEQTVEFWQTEQPELGVQGPIIMGISGNSETFGSDPVSELRNFNSKLTMAELYWGLTGESPPAELLTRHSTEARAFGRDIEFIEAVRVPRSTVAKLSPLETDLWQDFPGWNETDKKTCLTSFAINGVAKTLHNVACTGEPSTSGRCDHYEAINNPPTFNTCAIQQTQWLRVGSENVVGPTVDVRPFTSKLYYGYTISSNPPALHLWGDLPAVTVNPGFYHFYDWVDAAQKKMALSSSRVTHGNPGNTTLVRLVASRNIPM